MAEIVIVGDGPGGLSAALFLARGGHKVTVVGADKTAMHFAHLNNYLGAPDTMGTALQETARAQVVAAGAIITAGTVTNVSPRPPATRSTPKTGPRCRPTTCCCRRGGSTPSQTPSDSSWPLRAALPWTAISAPPSIVSTPSDARPGRPGARRSSRLVTVRSPPWTSWLVRQGPTSRTGTTARSKRPSRGQGSWRTLDSDLSNDLYRRLRAEAASHAAGLPKDSPTPSDTKAAESHVVIGTAATSPMLPTSVRTTSTATISLFRIVPIDCPARTKKRRSGIAAPAYARSSVLTVDATWSRPTFIAERTSPRRPRSGRRAWKLPHRGCLSDRDVVNGTKGTKHHSGEDQPTEIKTAGDRDDERLVNRQAAELGCLHDQPRQDRGEAESYESPQQGDRCHSGETVGGIEGEVGDGPGADYGDQNWIAPVEDGRDHELEEHHHAGAETEKRRKPSHTAEDHHYDRESDR